MPRSWRQDGDGPPPLGRRIRRRTAPRKPFDPEEYRRRLAGMVGLRVDKIAAIRTRLERRSYEEDAALERILDELRERLTEWREDKTAE